MNFEEHQTVAVPPSDLLKIMVLQRRDDVLAALEAYNKLSARSSGVPPHALKARIRTLFIDLKAALKNDMDEERFLHLSNLVDSDDVDEMLDAFDLVNEWLYNKKVTRFDTRKSYDPSRAEKENQVHHL